MMDNTPDRPWFRFSLRAIFVVTALIAASSWVFVESSKAVKLERCRNNLKQIGVAFQNYHDAFKHFPPAITYDADGTPLYSWRLLLVPFLESTDIYLKYNRKESWDGPSNSKLSSRMLDCFRCPTSTGGRYETNYVVVIGDQTAMPGSRAIRIREIIDGTSQTIMVVEVANSGINWLEPRDMSLEEALKGVNPKDSDGLCISSNHPGRAGVGYCDAHVEFLENSTTPEQLKKLLTISGEEQRIISGHTETRLKTKGGVKIRLKAEEPAAEQKAE